MWRTTTSHESVETGGRSPQRRIARTAASRPSRRSRSAFVRRGVAATEFAVLAPFLAILILGMFELARGIMVKQLLNDAARRACRIAIQPLKANSDAIADVNNTMTDNGLPAADATVVIKVNGVVANCNTAKQNDKVSVQVSIPTSDTFWISTHWLSSSSIVSDSVTMLRQD
jgi:Flp pilus assembly protein TadG